MKLRTIVNLFVLVASVAVVAMGCDGQRSCPSDVSCADLVGFTCGTSNECADASSCAAAKRLEIDGDQAACEAAWCSLGESYRECE